MFNTSMLPGICEMTKLVYVRNSRMRNLFIVEFLSSILAIFATLLTLLAIISNKTLHFNIRLLLLCFWGSIIITCIGTLIDSSYYLIAIISKIDAERCAWLSFTKSDCIGQFIILWLLIMPLIYYQNHDEEHIFPYCAYELFNPQVIANIQLTVIAIQISSFVIIIVLWTHNNKKLLQRKSQNETVSIRYQLRENVSTSKLLVPLGTIVTILVLTGALLHVLLPSRQTDNYWTNVDQFITYCFYAEIQVCFLPIASIILAIILCYTNQTIRSSLFHLLGLECCTKYSEQNLINISRDEFIRRAYFDQLQQQWNDLPSWNS